MNVGVLGLGLIGGSLARAYAKAGHKVFAWDHDTMILDFAKLAGVVQEDLNHTSIPQCDFILLAVYSAAAAQWVQENQDYISADTLVMDCCGIKEEICDCCFPIARQKGFLFVGGHPMAGSHNSGFKYSRSNLFKGAPMVLVPPDFDSIELLERVKESLLPCGFGSFSITTAKEHDKVIAFTSQMPHLLSNAFIKSPTALGHRGFSAGSYKDLTRVAWLNPQMWAELFLSNRDNLLSELDSYIESMEKYRDALQNNDADLLIKLLDEGRKRKEEIDG